MSSQSLGLWWASSLLSYPVVHSADFGDHHRFAHIVAGKYVTVTPPARLFVVNACLSYKLPEGGRGRATLLFGEYGSDEAVPIASLVKDVVRVSWVLLKCYLLKKLIHSVPQEEQSAMSLLLEAHETYAFATKGP